MTAELEGGRLGASSTFSFRVRVWALVGSAMK